MSRRIVIGILVVLILGVLGGTAYLVMQRLGDDSEGSGESSTDSEGFLTESDTRDGDFDSDSQTVDPTADDDGDGLPNSEEELWGTDINNPDTDGDGFSDGEEVQSNHNPTIASPNDALPEGFVPGRDVNPLDTAPDQDIAVDQYFQNNLDLSGGDENLTEAYREQYPEEERTPDTLNEFAQQQPIVTQLPTPVDRVVQTEAEDTPLVTSEYLEVAGSLGVFSNRNLLTEAINDLFGDGNPSTMRGLALATRLHQQRLIELRVPPSAENLHRLLLGYTELLAATYEQMALYNEDPVKAVVAMRQLEEIDRKFYPLIEQEVELLESQQTQ